MGVVVSVGWPTLIPEIYVYTTHNPGTCVQQKEYG